MGDDYLQTLAEKLVVLYIIFRPRCRKCVRLHAGVCGLFTRACVLNFADCKRVFVLAIFLL